MLLLRHLLRCCAGAGGNPRAIERAGWSLLSVRMVMFAAAGCFGMLAGLALIGLTTLADANIALRYTCSRSPA